MPTKDKVGKMINSIMTSAKNNKNTAKDILDKLKEDADNKLKN